MSTGLIRMLLLLNVVVLAALAYLWLDPSGNIKKNSVALACRYGG
jgi:hypothetical protein